MTKLNMIGQPCPIPMVEAKKVLSQPDAQGVVVLVDNSIAVQNLEKMAASLGCGFSIEEGEGEFTVTIIKGHDVPAASPPQARKEVSAGATILLTCSQLGASEKEPGEKLMQSFLLSLTDLPDAPEALLLLNTGVFLAVEGSQVLDHLRTLSEKGTKILACGQCLTYYGLVDKLAVGEISNMPEIARRITTASHPVTL
jgi:selenium metabolism protein YedF